MQEANINIETRCGGILLVWLHVGDQIFVHLTLVLEKFSCSGFEAHVVSFRIIKKENKIKLMVQLKNCRKLNTLSWSHLAIWGYHLEWMILQYNFPSPIKVLHTIFLNPATLWFSILFYNLTSAYNNLTEQSLTIWWLEL